MMLLGHFWTDLVWVGNTLYPRWFVFGFAFLLLFGAVTLIAAAVGGISWLIGKDTWR